MTVALSTALTPELEAEGRARDFVRLVQEARKAAGPGPHRPRPRDVRRDRRGPGDGGGGVGGLHPRRNAGGRAGTGRDAGGDAVRRRAGLTASRGRTRRACVPPRPGTHEVPLGVRSSSRGGRGRGRSRRANPSEADCRRRGTVAAPVATRRRVGAGVSRSGLPRMRPPLLADCAELCVTAAAASAQPPFRPDAVPPEVGRQTGPDGAGAVPYEFLDQGRPPSLRAAVLHDRGPVGTSTRQVACRSGSRPRTFRSPSPRMAASAGRPGGHAAGGGNRAGLETATALHRQPRPEPSVGRGALRRQAERSRQSD